MQIGDYYPDASDIIADLKATHQKQSHPRLLATKADFNRIHSQLASNALIKKWYDQIKNKVDSTFGEPLPERVLCDGIRMLDTSRKVLEDIKGLGLIYQILSIDSTLAQPYADRAWSILCAAGQFSDWNPNHFLDVAEMTAAFAIGYDWLFSAWSEEQKNSIRGSMLALGLYPALEVYRGQAANPYNWNRSGWLAANSNWNSVVNGGIAMGALAIADDSEELEAMSGEILQESIKSIQHVFPMFEPDGAYDEGTSYWNYNITYLVYYLSSFESALATDYGLSHKPGFEQTANFPIYLTGTFGVPFNYGNSWPDPLISSSLFWLGKKFNEPGVVWFHRSLLEKFSGEAADPLNLVWYDEQLAIEPKLSKDKIFQRVNVGTMRSAWNQSNALFVGFKGGDNTFGHSHRDLGSFVLDALGVRWASELGSDDYNLPGSSDLYYRIRSEGQNTLVINPDQSPGQKMDAKANIIASGCSPEQAFIVINLSEAYSEHAMEVKRGISLFDHRRNVLLQDEIKLKEAGEVYWFMHTGAVVELADDRKSAILSYNDRKLQARIVSPGNEVFHLRNSLPLPTSPQSDGQGVNTQSKLTVHAAGVEQLKLSIVFVPLFSWEVTDIVSPQLVDLNDWAIDIEEFPRLNNITLGGRRLEGFDPETFTYYVVVANEIPVIDAHARGGLNVSIQQTTHLPGVMKIAVETIDGTSSTTEYRIYLYSFPDHQALRG